MYNVDDSKLQDILSDVIKSKFIYEVTELLDKYCFNKNDAKEAFDVILQYIDAVNEYYDLGDSNPLVIAVEKFLDD